MSMVRGPTLVGGIRVRIRTGGGSAESCQGLKNGNDSTDKNVYLVRTETQNYEHGVITTTSTYPGNILANGEGTCGDVVVHSDSIRGHDYGRLESFSFDWSETLDPSAVMGKAESNQRWFGASDSNPGGWGDYTGAEYVEYGNLLSALGGGVISTVICSNHGPTVPQFAYNWTISASVGKAEIEFSMLWPLPVKIQMESGIKTVNAPAYTWSDGPLITLAPDTPTVVALSGAANGVSKALRIKSIIFIPFV